MAIRTGGETRERAGWRRPTDYLLVLFILFTWLILVPGVPDQPISLIELVVRITVSTVASIALFWRRQHHVWVLAAALASLLVSLVLRPHYPVLGPLVVALYATGRYAPARVCWTAAVVADMVWSGGLLATIRVPADEPLRFFLFLAGLPLLSFLMVVALGRLARLYRALQDRKRAEAVAAVVREEHLRIARELHDVVAHHISTVTVLIGGARVIIGTDPDQARQTLATAEQNGRDAMVELRQLLHVLRAEDVRRHPHRDDRAAGVTALPELVESVRDVGQRVRLEVTGTSFPLPTTVDHALYRIVQESLTNTRKHAAGAEASVVVRYEPDAVEVQVNDEGPIAEKAPPRSRKGSGGFGLIGIAERVALCGGRLDIGPRPEGGFRVHARIPVDKGDDRRRSTADSDGLPDDHRSAAGHHRSG